MPRRPANDSPEGGSEVLKTLPINDLKRGLGGQRKAGHRGREGKAIPIKKKKSTKNRRKKLRKQNGGTNENGTGATTLREARDGGQDFGGGGPHKKVRPKD